MIVGFLIIYYLFCGNEAMGNPKSLVEEEEGEEGEEEEGEVACRN